jgi:hypothetical protein
MKSEMGGTGIALNTHNLGGGQRHTPAALPPGKGPGTHSTGGWVGFGAGLDGCAKSPPRQDLNPGPFSP